MARKGHTDSLGNTDIEMLPSEVVRSLPRHAPVKPTRHSPHKTHKLQSAQKYTSVINGLEKAMAPHSSSLAWKIPWMEEPGRLQSMGLLRVGHD